MTMTTDVCNLVKGSISYLIYLVALKRAGLVGLS